MSVFITGGFGHIGSWIVKKFAEENKHILIYDIKSRDIDYLREYSNIKFIQGDILDSACLYKAIYDHCDEIEGIVHIAGKMGGPFFNMNPHGNSLANILGTLNVLEVSRIYGIKKVVYISSGSVYGDQDRSPTEEEPMCPSDLYGASKASAEMLGHQYNNNFDLDFRAVRIFFAYGPGRMPSELYPLYNEIFGQLEKPHNAKLDAGGDQYIDFTHVADIAKGVVCIFNAVKTKYQCYNIASGSSIKIPDAIELAQSISSCHTKYSNDIGTGKIILRGESLAIDRIADEFGYVADYTFKKGLLSYVDWINNKGCDNNEKNS